MLVAETRGFDERRLFEGFGLLNFGEPASGVLVVEPWLLVSEPGGYHWDSIGQYNLLPRFAQKIGTVRHFCTSISKSAVLSQKSQSQRAKLLCCPKKPIPNRKNPVLFQKTKKLKPQKHEKNKTNKQLRTSIWYYPT